MAIGIIFGDSTGKALTLLTRALKEGFQVMQDKLDELKAEQDKTQVLVGKVATDQAKVLKEIADLKAGNIPLSDPRWDAAIAEAQAINSKLTDLDAQVDDAPTS